MEAIRLPSLDGMRAFEVSARLGSFEKAAEELCITASAVSKRVATVEEVIGQPLFARGANHLELTSAGREYFSQVAPVLHQLSAMPLHHRNVQMRERLRITAPPTFARQILAPSISDFSVAHPEIEVEIVISPTVLDSPVTDADIEIRNGDTKAAGRVQLLRDVVCPMAAPELLEKLGWPRSPDALARFPLLRSPLESWIPWWRAAGLDWPEPGTGPKLVDLGLLIEAAVASQGVLLGRPSLTQFWMAGHRLIPLFDITGVPVNQYYMLSWVRRGSADLFANWLLELTSRIEDKALSTLRSYFSG